MLIDKEVGPLTIKYMTLPRAIKEAQWQWGKKFQWGIVYFEHPLLDRHTKVSVGVPRTSIRAQLQELVKEDSNYEWEASNLGIRLLPAADVDNFDLLPLVNQVVENFEIEYRSPPEAVALLVDHIQATTNRRLRTNHILNWNYGLPHYIRAAGWKVTLKLEGATVLDWLDAITAFNKEGKWIVNPHPEGSVFIGLEMGWRNNLLLVKITDMQARLYLRLDRRISQLMGEQIAGTALESDGKELKRLQKRYIRFVKKANEEYDKSLMMPGKF